MPVAYISDGTTVLSNLSLTGTLVGSTLSLVNATGSFTSLVASDVSVAGPLRASVITAGTSINVGGGTTITNSFATTVSIVTMTVGANYSLATTATINSLTTNHFVVIHAPAASGISAGLVVQAYASAASTLTIQFSNVSAAQTVQAGPAVYRVMAWRYSGI